MPTNKNAKLNNQSGYTLIEIVIVIVIISILAAVAVIGGRAVIKGQREQNAKARIMLVAEAQSRFRTALGRGRYGSLCSELMTAKSGSLPLIQTSTAGYEGGNCASPLSLGEWQVYSGEDTSVDTEYLKSRFSLFARQDGQKLPTYCMFEDRVLRRASEGEDCTRATAPVN